VLRTEEDGSQAEPAGEYARGRRRKHRIQEFTYWIGILLFAGVLAAFLVITLPERGRAEEIERNIAGTISAGKTQAAAVTATASAESLGTGQ
jgi:hypothetical protein